MRAWYRLCAMLLALTTCGAFAANDKAGLVLDVQGEAEIARSDGAARLKLLDYVAPGARLTLAPGSKASVSHYAARLIYRLTGPVQMEVEEAGMRHLSGNAPQTSAIGAKTVTAALHPNLGPAAIKLRALPQIVMRAPANGGSVLSTRPQFRWEASQPATFSIELTELPARTIAQASVKAPAWELPAKLELAYGKSYRWTVSYMADGRMRGAAATFSVPTKADADLIAALAPAAQAGADEWVLYATILKDWNMLDESQRVWDRIAERRPDLGHAR
jgi:hypothetical protein